MGAKHWSGPSHFLIRHYFFFFLQIRRFFFLIFILFFKLFFFLVFLGKVVSVLVKQTLQEGRWMQKQMDFIPSYQDKQIVLNAKVDIFPLSDKDKEHDENPWAGSA